MASPTIFYFLLIFVSFSSIFISSNVTARNLPENSAAPEPIAFTITTPADTPLTAPTSASMFSSPPELAFAPSIAESPLSAPTSVPMSSSPPELAFAPSIAESPLPAPTLAPMFPSQLSPYAPTTTLDFPSDTFTVPAASPFPNQPLREIPLPQSPSSAFPLTLVTATPSASPFPDQPSTVIPVAPTPSAYLPAASPFPEQPLNEIPLAPSSEIPYSPSPSFPYSPLPSFEPIIGYTTEPSTPYQQPLHESRRPWEMPQRPTGQYMPHTPENPPFMPHSPPLPFDPNTPKMPYSADNGQHQATTVPKMPYSADAQVLYYPFQYQPSAPPAPCAPGDRYCQESHKNRN